VAPELVEVKIPNAAVTNLVPSDEDAMDCQIEEATAEPAWVHVLPELVEVMIIPSGPSAATSLSPSDDEATESQVKLAGALVRVQIKF